MLKLSVHGDQIINSQGQQVYLRGTCVGGWMNMEEFINGYPGSEHGQRAVMAKILGPEKARFFFDRWLDHFFTEEDVTYIKSLGASVVRLPLNYRHFELDSTPFQYLEDGFRRLDQAIGWCEKHDLYVILDLHSVQGWQNTDWHCDNSSRHTFFWQQPHFQDRFVSLWEEFAHRYKDKAVIAGYNVMNEPVTNAPYGRYDNHYQPDWDTINRIYRRVVAAIRAIDPDHIIFLEGDYFSSRFSGLEAPFADNLVYSSHNYNAGGFGPGAYPGKIGGDLWNRQKQVEVLKSSEGLQFAQKYHVPLWVGEFGSAYNGPANEIPDRLRAMDDQIDVFEEFGAHWTTWTYKDIYVMGWVQLKPQSTFMQAIKPILEAKKTLSTDFWMGWVPPTPAKTKVFDLVKMAEEVIPDEDLDPQADNVYMSQQVLSGYVAGMMQPAFAKAFKGMDEATLDQVLTSYELKNLQPHQGLVEVLKKHMGRPA